MIIKPIKTYYGGEVQVESDKTLRIDDAIISGYSITIIHDDDFYVDEGFFYTDGETKYIDNGRVRVTLDQAVEYWNESKFCPEIMNDEDIARLREILSSL